MDEEMIAAVKAGDEAKVASLLSEDPGIASARAEDGSSALLTAIYYGKTAIVERLLAAGAKPSLFEAAALGRVDDVRRAIGADSAAVNSWSQDGFTPLQMACYFGQPEVVEALLESGADIAPPSRNPMRVTALHAAAAHHSEQEAERIVALILARGADVNAIQEGGYTALHAAAQNGYAGMARRLLDAGANAGGLTDKGLTPLDFADEKGHAAVAEMLRTRAGRSK